MIRVACVALPLSLIATLANAEARADVTSDAWEPGTSPARGLARVTEARGAGSEADGVYGRLDGDFTAALGLGATVPLPEGPLLPTLSGSLHYYWSVGVYANYSDSLRDVSTGEVARSFSVRLALRPAFLVRWSLDLEQGPALLDLMLDSLEASAGGAWFQPEGDDTNFGVVAALGFGVPLMLSAQGLWLELRTTLPLSGQADPAFEGALAWHSTFLSPWLDR